MATRNKHVRRKMASSASVGLTPGETKTVDRAFTDVAAPGGEEGGAVMGWYRDPVGGHGVVFAVLPLARVEPTPYQRDASDAHVKRLMTVIESVNSFLDPIIVIRKDGQYWTPNGNHRREALKKLGARSITALVMPDPDIAFKI